MPRLCYYLDDSHHPVATVRLEGVLDLASAVVVRRVVYKCLTSEPPAIVIDLADVLVEDDMAVMVFPALARTAANWPGIEIILCAAPGPVSASLNRLAVLRHLPLLSTREAALTRAAQRRTPVRLEIRLRPVPAACATAREFVADTCKAWDVAELADRVELTATELVANAVMHARTDIRVGLTLGEHFLRLAVRDGDPRVPRLGGNDDPERPAGRGLVIVDALATAWGTTPGGFGKIVWATFRRLPVGDRDPER